MIQLLDTFSGAAFLLGAINGIYPLKIHLLKDVKIKDSEKRKKLEEKIESLKNRLRIEKKIELIVISLKKSFVLLDAQAFGASLFSGRAAIALSSSICKYLSDAQIEFILAHELAHIRNNDHLIGSFISTFVSISTTMVLKILVPKWAKVPSLLKGSTAAQIGCLIGLVCLIIFSRWREEAADKIGFSVCSDDGKKSATDYFLLIQRTNLDALNDPNIPIFTKLYRTIRITNEGDLRFDLLHPPLKERISYLNV